ncbi:dihydrolipoyl dehydrogenase family protein [Fuscibacter oryzae]|uniref:FAD-dependent oxidoreductase n=1 Tax=Fuscibacter oryzae TaxID=2803939 RepID=A0A8J7MRT9_9RHOB|nr:FAD-dependent oxidoreductase [Fuscibacter oryzae]MBL4928462.1 FAD-dependent oxidoreductase [Fuscibacter oryzae]
MGRLKTDICIIGAGAGGLSVAAGAAQMGARVVLIEGGEMGGDCLNHGCIPSKALIAAAHRAHLARSGGLGIAPCDPVVDFPAVMAHVAATIATIAPHDSQQRFEGLGVTVLRGWARFTSPQEVAVGEHRIRARRFVIATGSRPVVPALPGIETVPVLTNETLFTLRDLPRHLMILGAGPIGCEMAQAFRRLGSLVTVVEAKSPLSREDPQATAAVLAGLQAEGVDLRSGANVVRLRDLGGQIEAVLDDGSVIVASHLLAATGRKPALDGLNLPAARIACDYRGIRVSANLRSATNRRVYAVGDAAGQGQFTHLAGAHAGVVIRQALLSLPARAPQQVPRVTYTDPELAQTGMTEAEARAIYGGRLTVLTEAYARNDRALTEAAPQGFVKVMAVAGRPVGATLVGPGAGDQLALWQLAIARRIKLSAIAGLVLPYPTRAETAKRAAGAYFSAKLFDNPALKRMVRLVQRFVP